MASGDKKRRRRRSSAVVLLNAVLTLLVLAILVVGGIVYYGISKFYEAGPSTAQTAFLVNKGSNLSALGTQLAQQGVIGDGIEPWIFSASIKLLGAHSSKLLPGQYLLPAGASMDDVLKILTETKPQEFFVNVIPGETSWQVAQRLNDPGESLTGDPVTPPLEGSLLAVRHDFFPGDTRQSVLDAMQKKMADEVADIWAGHDHSIDDVIKTPQQMVTLASLVEKETGLASERPEVASVFLNRLRKHMRLQTDPSVMYGITLGKGKLDRPLTTADLKAKTDYNTYQIDGLPPAPIANPGLDALNAVAHPAATNYLYFVAKSSDPSEGHTFAGSYAEHKKNVALYRKALADDAAEEAKEALEAEQASEAGDSGQ